MENKKLVRYSDDKMLFGVASGLADFINIDPVIVRLAFVLLTLFGNGIGLVIYFVMALIMPEESGPAAKVNILDEDEIIIKGS
jgi:phage shock protein PspC (stress-responsive transcriptional regulator)